MYEQTAIDDALMRVIRDAEMAIVPFRLTLGIEREFTFRHDPYMDVRAVRQRVEQECRALKSSRIDPEKHERHLKLLNEVEAMPHRIHQRFWDVYRMQVESPELEAADRKIKMTEPLRMILGGEEDASTPVSPTYEVQFRGGRDSDFTPAELIRAYLAFPDAVQRRTGQWPDYSTTNFHLHLGVADSQGKAVEAWAEEALRRLYGSLVEDALPLLMHAAEMRASNAHYLAFDNRELVTACEIQEQGTENCHVQLRKTYVGNDQASGYGFHPLIASAALLVTAFRAAIEGRGMDAAERHIPDACFRAYGERPDLPAIPLAHGCEHYPNSPAAARLGRMQANALLRADWGDSLLADMVQGIAQSLGISPADIQLAESCRRQRVSLQAAAVLPYGV